MKTENKIQNDNYDYNFAKFYDLYLTSHIDSEINKMLKFCDSNNIKNIVDFMCGTGNLLSILENKGYKTTGVDISKSMINVAKEKLKNTKLIIGDVSKIQLNKNFDLALSTADAINHLTNLNTIDLFFYNVKKCLNPGGEFIFDMNTKLGIINNALYISSSDENGLSIREGFVDVDHSIGYTRFQGFFKENIDDNYVRFDSLIYNHIYNINDIKYLLEKNDFNNIVIKDFNKLSDYDENTSERIIIKSKA